MAGSGNGQRFSPTVSLAVHRRTGDVLAMKSMGSDGCPAPAGNPYGQGLLAHRVARRTVNVLAVKSMGRDQAAELRREQGILPAISWSYVARVLDPEVSASEHAHGVLYCAR